MNERVLQKVYMNINFLKLINYWNQNIRSQMNTTKKNGAKFSNVEAKLAGVK